MANRPHGLALLATFALLVLRSEGDEVKTPKSLPSRAETARNDSAILWREPTDIHSRNLFYGPGGAQDQPHGPYTFVEEDLNGSNPKYIVRDRDKVKWTVKLGNEARPETVASRLVWAVGYAANEDYFLEDVQVEGMPAHLKRGGNQIGPGGVLHAVRLKRHLDDEKGIGSWKWRDNVFAGTRELNGLKVMMALINNWDLKDVNNKIYGKKDGAEQTYMVSDLGSSFGATGLAFPFRRSKGDLEVYIHSKFIVRISPEYVDFRTPSRPALIYVLEPPRFIYRVLLDGIDRHIPRSDARWMGGLLSGLSAEQIHDAFRAAGYTPEQVNAFSNVVQDRIMQLNQL